MYNGQYPITVLTQQGINFNYQWSPAIGGIVSGQNTSSILADVAKSGSYQVTVTHPTLGCKQDKTITLDKFDYKYKLDTPEVLLESKCCCQH